MAATMQKQRPQAQAQTLAQHEETKQVLPTEILTKQQSVFFIKKFTALSISNICFLRGIFPDEAFADRKLDRVNLKILRMESTCSEARQTVMLLSSVFQCLDNGWIKGFDIGIYEGNEISPQNLLEVWHFQYASSECGFSQEQEAGVQHLKFGFNKRKIETDVTRREMHQMIRTLRFDTQHMRPLPADARMIFRITHSDETPNDMVLSGFETMDEPTKFRFFEHENERTVQAAKPVKLKIGDVQTEFDAVKVRLTAREGNLDYMETAVGLDFSHSDLGMSQPGAFQPATQPSKELDIASTLLNLGKLAVNEHTTATVAPPEHPLATTPAAAQAGRKSKRSLARKKPQPQQSEVDEFTSSDIDGRGMASVPVPPLAPPLAPLAAQVVAPPRVEPHALAGASRTSRPSAKRRLAPPAAELDTAPGQLLQMPTTEATETAEAERARLMAAFDISDSQESIGTGDGAHASAAECKQPRKFRRTSVLRKPISCGSGAERRMVADDEL